MQPQQSRPAHLHQWELQDSRDLPVPGTSILTLDEHRKVTDVCCLILGVLYGLILFIIACVLYSSYNLKKSNYPSDSAGTVCQLDTQTGVNNYPFLFFNDINDPANDRYDRRQHLGIASNSVRKKEFQRIVTTTVR